MPYHFFQGPTGPIGLKGDAGPQGAPGDTAKGVRLQFVMFPLFIYFFYWVLISIVVFVSHHNRSSVQPAKRASG